MIITVEGIKVQLTTEQVAYIKQAKLAIKQMEVEKRKKWHARIEREKVASVAAFRAMFIRFGFKVVDTSDWVSPDQIVYENKKHGWYADIHTDRPYIWVNIMGTGIPDMGMMAPGTDYETVKEATAALKEAKSNNQ